MNKQLILGLVVGLIIGGVALWLIMAYGVGEGGTFLGQKTTTTTSTPKATTIPL